MSPRSSRFRALVDSVKSSASRSLRRLKERGSELADEHRVEERANRAAQYLRETADRETVVAAYETAAERASRLAGDARAHAARLADEYDVDRRTSHALEYVCDVANADVVRDAYDTTSDFASRVAQQARERGSAVATEYQLAERSREVVEFAQTIADSTEATYGALRQKLRHRAAADTPEALLLQTRDELHYIIACVLQIPRSDASKWAGRFGKSLSAKLTAAGVTTSLLGLVSAFGTAGTGAAISGLSGAAATSATLAWVGGLIGGGMAAGAFLTGGVGLVVGYAAYQALGSTARSFEDLSDVDKGVIETCSVLAEAINESLDDSRPSRLTSAEAEMLFRNALLPLFESLEEHHEDICSRLDTPNAIAFRQHALLDFRHVVIDGFRKFLDENRVEIRNRSTNHVEYVIGGVVLALLSRNPVGSDLESQLVLEALRRSDGDLQGASELEIADYLADFSPEQLQGIANNVKGIYHELLFVEDYNATHSDSYAELFGATNHAGADIQIRDLESNELLQEIQLKATDSSSYVREHVERYPDVEVAATEEVASRLQDVDSSGFSNQEITEQVVEDFEVLEGSTLGDQVVDSAGLATVVATGREAIEVLNGRKSAGESARSVAEAAAVGATATGIAAFLFS